MKISALILLFSLCSTAIFSQKIKFDDDIAYVNGEAFLNWTTKAMSTEISVSGLSSDREEIFVMFLDYKDPKEVTKSNSQGYVRWIELNFVDLGIKCEIDSRFQKGLVKVILENNLYVDGVLNEENVRRFVQKYGTRYSDNRPTSGGNVNIIINN